MKAIDIAALIAHIVGTEDISVDDNFFDIGGNSVLALTLISDIKSQFGVKIPLIDLIHAPTAREIALLIDSTNS
jgi:acyl carrier protein